MVRLQRIFSRKVKGESYYKWQITLPAKVVEEAGWKPGMVLEAEHRQGRVTLRPVEDGEESQARSRRA